MQNSILSVCVCGEEGADEMLSCGSWNTHANNRSRKNKQPECVLLTI